MESGGSIYHFTLNQMWSLDEGMTAYDSKEIQRQYCLIGDFDAMCKWVANGRKLEDLQGDTASEYIEFHKVPIGEMFTYFGLGGCALKSDYERAINMNGKIGNVIMDMEKYGLVWPVRFDLGDTITIKGGENG